MSKFFNVNFYIPNVKKIYSNCFKSIEWPKTPFRVMDIGCASGRAILDVLQPLLPDTYSEIVGTDINEERINYCKTLKLDPRISFELMNIETKTLPKKFEKRFDYLFSSFVLHYVNDLRQTLLNCSILLKPKGELVFIYMYSAHPLYEVYKRMYSIDEWKPYTKDFKNYTPNFGFKDPIDETKLMFHNCGLEVVNIELNHDLYESTADSYLDLFTSMDPLKSVIPEKSKQKYEMIFSELLGDIAGFSLAEEDLKKQAPIYFPAIVIHARNSLPIKNNTY